METVGGVREPTHTNGRYMCHNFFINTKFRGTVLVYETLINDV